jgi:hypothetical protein
MSWCEERSRRCESLTVASARFVKQSVGKKTPPFPLYKLPSSSPTFGLTNPAHQHIFLSTGSHKNLASPKYFDPKSKTQKIVYYGHYQRKNCQMNTIIWINILDKDL